MNIAAKLLKEKWCNDTLKGYTLWQCRTSPKDSKMAEHPQFNQFDTPINKTKDKNHMLSSIDAGKSLWHLW